MWIVAQIGAREHYAIPRALHEAGSLGALITDFWIEPGSMLARLPGGRRLKDRFHPELADSKVIAPNLRMLGFEASSRLRKQHSWEAILERNGLFQRLALAALERLAGASSPTLFSYSYAARNLFRFAKERGWTTVLGQIDPGPEEERIVGQEHQRYPNLGSRWQPAPSAYWESWREELELANRIIVNSEWSKECLLKEGVPETKMEVVPLVYEKAETLNADGAVATLTSGEARNAWRERSEGKSGTLKSQSGKGGSFQLLFLGQINLRKGVGRLLDAMRLLKNEPVELMLAGPSEIDPSAWADLPMVKWIGPVPRSEVGGVYRSADAFILPTLSDGYALTQLEALSNGLPVIASKHCGEAVENGRNGWVLDDLEPATIAETIRAAVNGRVVDTQRSGDFSSTELGKKMLEGQAKVLIP